MSGIVAVTGANGFVGRALCAEAVRRGLTVRGITRSLVSCLLALKTWRWAMSMARPIGPQP
ncbi:NAD-dependent epimerase/dehydratase family protein [Rhodoferax sp. AJA081-3]|uniref:NAD-dependent epimerase/dehydratase family protein n=1 Tax=Rhodoferax sp. AJA081-3 TaxID=2752316 RepID=UPI0035302E4B